MSDLVRHIWMEMIQDISWLRKIPNVLFPTFKFQRIGPVFLSFNYRRFETLSCTSTDRRFLNCLIRYDFQLLSFVFSTYSDFFLLFSDFLLFLSWFVVVFSFNFLFLFRFFVTSNSCICLPLPCVLICCSIWFFCLRSYKSDANY